MFEVILLSLLESNVYDRNFE